MARPEPADIQMRIDLVLGAVDEVTARVDEVLRQEGSPSVEEFAQDVYRLVGHLAEAVGNTVMALKLVREGEGGG